MSKDLYFLIDYESKIKYTYITRKWLSWQRTDPYMFKMIGRIYLILDAHSTEYT